MGVFHFLKHKLYTDSELSFFCILLLVQSSSLSKLGLCVLDPQEASLASVLGTSRSLMIGSSKCCALVCLLDSGKSPAILWPLGITLGLKMFNEGVAILIACYVISSYRQVRIQH